MYGLITQNSAGLDVCGVVVPLPEYNGMGMTMYTASARKKGAPVYAVFTKTAGQQVTATTPASATYTIIGFAYQAIGAGEIGLFVISGFNVPCLVDDTSTIDAGSALEVIASGVALIDQTGTGDTPITVHAVLEEALTAAEGSGSPVLKLCTVTPSFPYKTIAGS